VLSCCIKAYNKGFYPQFGSNLYVITLTKSQYTFERKFEKELVKHLGVYSLQKLISSIIENPSVTISGDICTGKTTLAKTLAKKMSLGIYSLGDVYRTLADKQILSIEDFSRNLANNIADARLLDWATTYEACMVIAKGDILDNGVVVDGKLAGYYGSFLKYLGKDNVFNIYLFCDEEIKRKRVSQRHNLHGQGHLKFLQRRDYDALRFSTILNIYPDDYPSYDCYYNTGKIPIREILIDLNKKILDRCYK